MNKTLIILVLAVIVLSWNFIFTDAKVGLTDQAKVLQGLSSAIAYKTAVANYLEQKGSLPGNDDWQKNKPRIKVYLSQTIVSTIEVGKDGPGVISVLYTSKPGLDSPELINGKKINLIPSIQNGKLEWTCKGSMEARFLPKNCSTM